jgi:hypothetical protein
MPPRSGAPPGRRRRRRAANAAPSQYRLSDDGLHIILPAPTGTAARELTFAGLIWTETGEWELTVNGLQVWLNTRQLLAGPDRDPLRKFCLNAFAVWPDDIGEDPWRDLLITMLLFQARLR